MTVGTAALFDQLCDQLHVQPDRKGECWVDCPQCGKGGKHFSFNERAGHCFACDYSGSLRQIAELLGTADRPAPRAARPAPPPRPDFWQKEPARWLDRYCAALDRLARWQAYKPLTLDSIARYRLGVGKLPMWSEERRVWYEWPHRRLIVPLWGNGQIVGFYGRACSADDHGPKWLGASGTDKSHLFLVGEISRNYALVVVENYIDAILASQANPGATYAAVGGATWRDEWTKQIAAARPARVLVWLDHDLAGNGSRYHHAELLAAWRAGIAERRAANPALAQRPWPQPPEPRGPKIANALLDLGVRASVYEWPRGTPLKADIGYLLMEHTHA